MLLTLVKTRHATVSKKIKSSGSPTAGRSLREMSEDCCQCLQLYGGGEYTGGTEENQIHLGAGAP